MTDWKETKRLILEDNPTSQVVMVVKGRQMRCLNRAEDLDHCLIRRNKRFGIWLDKQIWNYQPSCANCNRHSHATDAPTNRRHWLEHQVKVYGLDVIKDALIFAPPKMQVFNTDYQEVVKWIKEIENE